MGILGAARRLFAEKGFDAVNIEDFVQEAGVARGTFYYYFSSKSEVAMALAGTMIEDIIRACRQVLAIKTTYDEIVDDTVAAVFYVAEGYKDIFHLTSAVQQMPEHRDGLRTVAVRYAAVIREIIAVGQAEGKVRPDVNLELAANLTFMIVDSALRMASIMVPTVGREVYLHEVSRLIKNAWR